MSLEGFFLAQRNIIAEDNILPKTNVTPQTPKPKKPKHPPFFHTKRRIPFYYISPHKGGPPI